jgi:Sulfate permease family
MICSFTEKTMAQEAGSANAAGTAFSSGELSARTRTGLQACCRSSDDMEARVLSRSLPKAKSASLGSKGAATTRSWSVSANLAASFFQGFPISSSSSRTPVAEAAGARTQLTGAVGALVVALLVLTAPNLLRHLPNAALAAVVIASAIGLLEITDLRRIYRIQRWEFWLSIVCLVGVAVLGAIPGIGLAIWIAVIEFLWDGWRPHSALLGRAEGVRGHHDITRYPHARQIPGLVLFRASSRSRVGDFSLINFD